ncbi:uncharacterized protein LOC114671352 [Macaca mulatta]
MAAGDLCGRAGIRAAPAPRAPPALLLRVALGTWHSLPPESRAAQPAGRSSPLRPGPLRRRRQRHLPRATGRGPSARGPGGWRGRAGEGLGGAASCSRENRNALPPALAPCYGALDWARFMQTRSRSPERTGCRSPWWPEAGKELLINRSELHTQQALRSPGVQLMKTPDSARLRDSSGLPACG